MFWKKLPCVNNWTKVIGKELKCDVSGEDIISKVVSSSEMAKESYVQYSG